MPTYNNHLCIQGIVKSIIRHIIYFWEQKMPCIINVAMHVSSMVCFCGQEVKILRIRSLVSCCGMTSSINPTNIMYRDCRYGSNHVRSSAIQQHKCKVHKSCTHTHTHHQLATALYNCFRITSSLCVRFCWKYKRYMRARRRLSYQ